MPRHLPPPDVWPSAFLVSPKKRLRESLLSDVKSFLDSAGLGRGIAKFRGKETVFAQGDRARNVMYIQEGGIKLSAMNESGKEAVVAALGPSDFFGVSNKSSES